MNSTSVASHHLPHSPAVYSQGVRAGNLLFVAGQVGVNYGSGKIANDFEAQARQAFENLSLVLQAYGSSLRQVVKTTVWLRDAENFEAMNRLYAEFFPQDAPARSTPIVDLPRPDLLISIEAIAVVGQ